MPRSGRGCAVDDPSYLPKLFALTEATIGMAVALGLARMRGKPDWSRAASEVVTRLERAALGTRLEIVHQLDALQAGVCGWALSERLSRTAGLLEAVGADAGKGPPSVAQALDALVRARNMLAHPSAGGPLPTGLLREWEAALHELMAANPLLSASTMLSVQQVRREPGGR